MSRIFIALLSLLFSVCSSQSQTWKSTHSNKINGFILRNVIIHGDTLPLVNLKEVVLTSQLCFENEEDAKKYRHLVRDIRRVYPYAVLISEKVREYDLQMANMSRAEKREFMKRIEPVIKDQFEKIFRSNTVDQAQVLIKLVDRETGHSSFHLIKQFKGGWNAFMWQSIARIVGTNLKVEYDPDGEDRIIERIVQELESGGV